MDIYQLIALCHDYTLLGWAVQEQFQAVLAGEPIEDQNFNALEMILRFLDEAIELEIEEAEDIADQIKETIEEHRYG